VALKSCEGVDGCGVRKFTFFCQESMRRFDMSPFATRVVAPAFVMNLLCGKFRASQPIMTFPFLLFVRRRLKYELDIEN
jgi:hypothetical protein